MPSTAIAAPMPLAVPSRSRASTMPMTTSGRPIATSRPPLPASLRSLRVAMTAVLPGSVPKGCLARRHAARRLASVVELVYVALARAGLGAEAALHPAQVHAGRRAARLRVAGAAALRGAVAVAARLDALGLALLLGEVRRPRRVAEAPLLVAARELQQLVERARVGVDVRRGIALAQPLRHRVDAQVARLDVGDLGPVERARHASVRRRAHGVAGGDGAVARVLVVIDEDAVALLLPPLARRQLRRAPLHLARERQRRAAH